MPKEGILLVTHSFEWIHCYVALEVSNPLLVSIYLLVPVRLGAYYI